MFQTTYGYNGEGKDDTKQEEGNSTDTQATINLREHFLAHGLSQSAYDKIAPEIENGDMNVNVLMHCNDNDLNAMKTQYNFTFLQKKAFVAAVNTLKSQHNNNSNDNNNTKNNMSGKTHLVYVSPDEQSILDEIKELGEILRQLSVENVKIKENNSNKIKLTILKLENCKKLVVECVNTEINKLVKEVC